MVIAYNSVSASASIRGSACIHGIITDGGQAVNAFEHTAAFVSGVRATTTT
jgi:hypothetical protein